MTRTRTKAKTMTFGQRLSLLWILGATAAVLLTMRLFLLQVVEHDDLQQRAERMRLGWDAVLPRRGAILDARGRLLAVDAPGFELGIRALPWVRARYECRHCARVYYAESDDDLPRRCYRCRSRYSAREGDPLYVATGAPDLRRVAEALGTTVEKLDKTVRWRVGQVKDYIERQLSGLAGAKRERRSEDLWHDFGRRHRVIKREVPYEVVREVALHPCACAGFSVRTTTSRRYPGGPAFTHVVGRVSRMTRIMREVTGEDGIRRRKAEYEPAQVVVRREERLDDPVRRKDSVTGVVGIEARFDDVLRGVGGWVEVRREPRTGERTVLAEQRALDGETIQLTIAIEDQQAAYDAMGGREPGAFVVVNAETGAVIALVSTPSYDAERYSDVHDRWNDPKLERRSPLYDRAYALPQIPGSILKPFTALAAIGTGDITLDETIFCERFFLLNGRRLSTNRCLHEHGGMDMRHALRESCNVYFQTLLDRMRRHDREDAFFVTGSEFGFGRATGLEIEPRAYREGRRRLGNWTPFGIVNPGTMIACGIGQGTVTLTVAQIARAYAALATGALPRLHLVQRVGDRTTRLERQDLDLDGAALATIRSSLLEVAGPTGTASGHGLERWGIACKTGTAQIGPARAGRLALHNAWIAGFAGAREGRPGIAFAMVLLDTPMGGSEACGGRLADFFRRFYKEREQ